MDGVRVLCIQNGNDSARSGEAPGKGGQPWGAQVAQDIRNKRLEKTWNAAHDWGACSGGSLPSHMGLPERLRSLRASRLGPPHAAARGRAGRGRRDPSASHALPSPPGGSAAPGAECGRGGAGRHLFDPHEDQTPTAPDPAGPGCARESVCSPGPGGGRGAAAAQARALILVPEPSP